MRIKIKPGTGVEQFVQVIVEAQEMTGEDVTGIVSDYIEGMNGPITLEVSVEGQTAQAIIDGINFAAEHFDDSDYQGVLLLVPYIIHPVKDQFPQETTVIVSGDQAEPFIQGTFEGQLNDNDIFGDLDFDKPEEEEYVPEPILLGGGVYVTGLSKEEELVLYSKFQLIVNQAMAGHIAQSSVIDEMRKAVAEYPHGRMTINTMMA